MKKNYIKIVFLITIFILSFGFTSNLIAADTIVAPTIIPYSAPEIVNPSRGLFKNGTALVELPSPMQDAYGRYAWSDIEKTIDTYDFTVIDKDIDQAILNGQRFAFRIRSMKSKTSGKSFVPEYLANDSYGWFSNGTFIPDWNNDYYLSRVDKLLYSINQHFISKGYLKHISWVEIGMYGQYGEWSLSGIYPSTCNATIPYVGSPDCYASDANLNRIIDMHFNNFPTIRKIMMAKTRANPVVYALSKSSDVGWRVDCLGQSGYFDFPTNPNFAESWAIMENRWKTAPVVVEYCTDGNLDFADPAKDDAKNHIEKFHISSIANYNIALTAENTAEKFIQNAKLAGYRIGLNKVQYGSPIPNSEFSINTTWTNYGNAPIYDSWDVYFMLKDTTGNIVWQVKSSSIIKGLLPNLNSPYSVADKYVFPGNIISGKYKLLVFIKDPQNLRKPLSLAIEGKQADGAYILAEIDVSSGGQNQVFNNADQEPDGDVDYIDFNSFVSNFGLSGIVGWIRSDIIKDGTVNIFDFNKLISNFGL